MPRPYVRKTPYVRKWAEVTEAGMYEIRWPQRRWLNIPHIIQWYERARRDGLILDTHLDCTKPSEMAEALSKSGCFVLTGNTK